MLCGDLCGKEIQKKGIWVYVDLTHFAVQRKLTQSVEQLYSNKMKNIKKIKKVKSNQIYTLKNRSDYWILVSRGKGEGHSGGMGLRGTNYYV